ncbi:DUF6325 family protein [Conyzicola sp.]|uniref:DUF6325 family protein n=1 Tax=Conyzicola sp. TaxID=1969404 RepID=UPI003989188E
MTEFTYGPVEFLLIAFDSDKPSGGILEAITELIESETINLLDLVFVSKGSDGTVTSVDIEDATDEYGFGTIELEATGLASDEDIQELADDLPPGTSAALLVVELLWAKKLATRLTAAGGFVVHSDRIPAPVVNAALAALETES